MKNEQKILSARKTLPLLKKSLENCDLCFHACSVNRVSGEKGVCQSGVDARVYSYSPHHGEEPPISGVNGSGTIFFSECSMSCECCQNYQFSQKGAGKTVTSCELAGIMMSLKEKGCHNINLVSPTHYMPAILEALIKAWESGLDLPVVYNTGGYDSLWLIKILDGLVDIYLPDMKYSDNSAAVKYSKAPGYGENNRGILREMHRQAGGLDTEDDIAIKGLIVRLLILPERKSGTELSLDFIARELSPDTHVSIMSQYYPAYNASKYPELYRPINIEEYESVLAKIEEFGMKNGWVQPFNCDFDHRFAGENFDPNL